MRTTCRDDFLQPHRSRRRRESVLSIRIHRLHRAANFLTTIQAVKGVFCRSEFQHIGIHRIRSDGPTSGLPPSRGAVLRALPAVAPTLLLAQGLRAWLQESTATLVLSCAASRPDLVVVVFFCQEARGFSGQAFGVIFLTADDFAQSAASPFWCNRLYVVAFLPSRGPPASHVPKRSPKVFRSEHHHPPGPLPPPSGRRSLL